MNGYEKFIKEQMANVDGSVDITDEFEQFWEVEKQASLKSICQTEHLGEGKFRLFRVSGGNQL